MSDNVYGVLFPVWKINLSVRPARRRSSWINDSWTETTRRESLVFVRPIFPNEFHGESGSRCRPGRCPLPGAPTPHRIAYPFPPACLRPPSSARATPPSSRLSTPLNPARYVHCLPFSGRLRQHSAPIPRLLNPFRGASFWGVRASLFVSPGDAKLRCRGNWLPNAFGKRAEP
jgi:hypothetical protein